MNCKVLSGANLWGIGGIGGRSERGGGFSHESEHDLAMMVSDFLENGSAPADSWCSSDSDSALSDFSLFAEKIQVKKHAIIITLYGEKCLLFL